MIMHQYLTFKMKLCYQKETLIKGKMQLSSIVKTKDNASTINNRITNINKFIKITINRMKIF